MTKVVAIANQKGGVGKTTTVINLGVFLANQGHSVMFLDMDPQTTLTKRIINGYNEGDIPPSIKRKAGEANVLGLFDEEFEGQPFQFTENQYLFGATSHVAINNNCTDEEIDHFQRNVREAAKNVDFILIDCPPMIGNIQYAVLSAASHILMPSTLEKGSQEGLERLFMGITLSRQKKNQDLKVAGIILNSVKSPITNLQKQIKKEIEEAYGNLVLKANITDSTKVTEAEYFNQSVIQWNPKAAQKIGVLDLMDEITQRVMEA